MVHTGKRLLDIERSRAVSRRVRKLRKNRHDTDVCNPTCYSHSVSTSWHPTSMAMPTSTACIVYSQSSKRSRHSTRPTSTTKAGWKSTRWACERSGESLLSHNSANSLRYFQEKRLAQMITENRWNDEDTMMAEFLIDIPGTFNLHRSMWTKTLRDQGTDEQHKLFLEPSQRYEIIGCYSQTELGHGSNVQGLETTATYIPEDQEFELHSPTLTSAKWWSGGLGRTATHSCVMAQLVIKGKNYGPHPFVVPIRDPITREALPGCTIGDIGPKFGFNTVDNGFLLLDHVRM